jgi:hypothetical protein
MQARLLLATVTLSVACSTSQAIDTGIGVATAVTETAINRELTGDCYSACGDGTRCNRKTGLCQRESELEMTDTVTPELTLEDRCSMVRKDLIADRERGLGEQHPAMVGYRRTLDRCDALLASTDPAARICGDFELELVALESDGFGKNHPDVVAQRALLDKCRADVAARPTSEKAADATPAGIPTVRVSEPTVGPAYSPDLIKAVIRRSKPGLAKCGTAPSDAPRGVLTFTIESNGRVKDAAYKSGGKVVAPSPWQKCVLDAIRAMEFVPPNGTITVTYPLATDAAL